MWDLIYSSISTPNWKVILNDRDSVAEKEVLYSLRKVIRQNKSNLNSNLVISTISFSNLDKQLLAFSYAHVRKTILLLFCC